MLKKFALSAAVAAVLLPASAMAANVITLSPIAVSPAANGVTTLLTFDVSGIASWGTLGDASNVVALLNIGAGSTLDQVGWNVNLTATSPSWLSDIAVQFSDSVATQDTAISLAPSATNAAGTASYVSSGLVDLTAANLSFAVGSDGKLRLEFYETWDDIVGAKDGMWNSGTLTLAVTAATAVPEPGTYGLMALGMVGVLLAARRRRAA
ncbi:PEP-CTERM sorting domain-containing protein [Paucibacter sp. R3-3]|uniref:PEP-CTERM sorting domain-containing protein n=1 Tax=Roseateles agri TaxID=3098619 RepID=A0ABU5DFP2_9BURK|nr:PEP-CTERM sorting domain-containing protein [Paucibacter sp. R3-3]MDY0745076.1 PEP-CTERM sorting domain-containing protein [Paucibacter sp. R3-3]